MLSATLAVTLCTALALYFPTTRNLGIVGIGLLALAYPTVVSAIVILAGIAYLIYHHKRRSS